MCTTCHIADRCTLCCPVPVREKTKLIVLNSQNVKTYIAEAGINDSSHFGDSPLDYIAEILVVDVVVLLAHGSLGTLFEFVLTVAEAIIMSQKRGNSEAMRLTRARDRHVRGQPSTCSALWPVIPFARPGHRL